MTTRFPLVLVLKGATQPGALEGDRLPDALARQAGAPFSRLLMSNAHVRGEARPIEKADRAEIEEGASVQRAACKRFRAKLVKGSRVASLNVRGNVALEHTLKVAPGGLDVAVKNALKVEARVVVAQGLPAEKLFGTTQAFPPSYASVRFFYVLIQEGSKNLQSTVKLV